MSDERREHLIRFYWILDRLEEKIGGARRLAECDGRMDWPTRGVYFFREPGETRSDTGIGPRIVEVGTNGTYSGERRRLWDRLREHKGSETGGGNHRISLFRNVVGTALINKNGLDVPSWGKGKTARGNKEVKIAEHPLEREVSTIIRDMPFLWLSVGDDAGKGNRSYLVRNSLALLSNYNQPPLDPPSPDWLGLRSNRERVRNSGLWNSNHVDERYDPAFLDQLYWLVAATGKVS
jgi:hypothetical protein